MSDEKVESRVPPHDLEAEAATLSASMNDATALDQAAEILRPEHFYSEAHRRIWEAILYLHALGSPVDLVTVGSRLRETDRLAQVGGMPYLTTVLNAAPALSAARKYAETVYERFLVRQAILVCQRAVAQGYAGAGDARGFVGSIASSIFELESGNSRTELQAIGPILHAALSKVSAANARGSNITGQPTGFTRYDRITSGLHGGEVTVVAARPGMGKTSLALDIAQNVAAFVPPAPPPGAKPELRSGVVIFSLEMPRDQVGARMICSLSRVDVGRYRTGMLSKPDWERLTRGAAALSALPIFVDDKSSIGLTELRAKVRRKAAEMLTKGIRLALVVIDYLQLMEPEQSGGAEHREREVAGISRGLKVLAKDMDVPVLVLSQLNRAVETRGEKRKRPQLSDLRESGAIEQDADNICFIYRDDYYEKESAERNVAELIIAKQRNGPTDTVRVRWDGAYTRFDNLAEGEYEEFNRGGD